MRGNKYGARKTKCARGHNHASRREAKYCNELSLRELVGEISDLRQQPKFVFVINGEPIKMKNGHKAALTADFAYTEDGEQVVEEVKGMVVRDFPLRWALAQHLWPEIDWRIVT